MTTLPSIDSGQFLQNQAIGSVVAASLKRVKLRRKIIKVTQSDTGPEYQPPVYYYSDILPFHAITQEAYEFSADATQHPVESGVMFSDHVILKPIRVSGTFEISNYDGLGNNAQWAKYTLGVFTAVWRQRILMGLITTHTKLNNMVMIAFTVENNAPEWGKLVFRATFQQVNLVTLESQQFTSYQVQGDITQNSTKQLGKQPSTPLTAAAKNSFGKKSQKTATSKSSIFNPFDKSILGVDGSRILQ